MYRYMRPSENTRDISEFDVESVCKTKFSKMIGNSVEGRAAESMNREARNGSVSKEDNMTLEELQIALESGVDVEAARQLAELTNTQPTSESVLAEVGTETPRARYKIRAPDLVVHRKIELLRVDAGVTIYTASAKRLNFTTPPLPTALQKEVEASGGSIITNRQYQLEEEDDVTVTGVRALD
jgi:hypothetical protein